MSIRDSWQRITAWHEANTPPGKFVLAPGATEEELAAFEATIGRQLPADVRESFLLHNGGVYSEEWFGYPDFMGQGELLPLEQILEQWNMYISMQESDGYADSTWDVEFKSPALKPVFWSETRIPLTDNSGNHLFIDLDPAPAGQYGQIIEHDHEIGPEAVLAPSWEALLQQYADDLEAGKYIYSEDSGQVELR